MKPLYIFDLDGTLALVEHRRHYIADKKSARWDLFYSECHKDEPNWPVLITMEALYRQGNEIWIWSGRSDEVYGKTADWLHEHTLLTMAEIAHSLRMRAAGDFTKDDDLKRGWYEQLVSSDKRRMVAVFDDRDRMVAMWRGLGVVCFQVAPGNF